MAALAGALAAAPAAAWDLDLAAPREDLEAFHRHFALAAYPYPRHPAAPLGLTGFDLFADLSYAPELDERGFAAAVLDGDLPGGGLSVARVGVRKGLPGRIDLGASYGTVLGSDLDLLGAEVQWAVLGGGAVSPALGLRLAGSQSEGERGYRLRQVGLEALVSKGFAVLTPFAGAGVVRSEGRFRPADGEAFETEETGTVLFAGLTLNLLIPRITVEVEQGETLQGTVRVAVGF